MKPTPERIALEAAFDAVYHTHLFRVDGRQITADDLGSLIVSLCDAIDRDDDEFKWGIGECFEFSLADLIIAAFWAYSECYDGQASPEYAVYCRLGDIFKPGCTYPPGEDDTEWWPYHQICELLCPGSMTSVM